MNSSRLQDPRTVRQIRSGCCYPSPVYELVALALMGFANPHPRTPARSEPRGFLRDRRVPVQPDLPAPIDRTLVPVPEEANTVRHIFQRYLEIGSVEALALDLKRRTIVSKRRASRNDHRGGIGRSHAGRLIIYCASRFTADRSDIKPPVMLVSTLRC
jgi:hypothetical protein